ncbi:MAG: adenylate/guanylate cyclase domain-containing protein [Gemmataceae bacterium]
MKFTLRITLLTIVLFLIVLTVAGLGYSSYRNARSSAEELTGQILDQTSQRIDSEINDLLWTANNQGNLDLLLFQSGHLSANDFKRTAHYWVDVLKVHPKLVRLGLALEEPGDWHYVMHLHGGKTTIGVLHSDPQSGEKALRTFWPGDYPSKPYFAGADTKAVDPRQRAWYAEARKTGRQVWSEAYVFQDGSQDNQVPAVTCATPIFRHDNSLVGVLAASFDLYDFCLFLKELEIGKSGYAFVVEYNSNGKRQVIAHPNPSLLLRTTARGSEGRSSELIPGEDLNDPHVAAFMSELPPKMSSSDLEQMKRGGMRRVDFIDHGVHYLGSYRCLSTEETPNWLICTIVPEEEVLGAVKRGNRQTFFIGVGVFVLAVLIGMMISGQVARPLEQLAHETEKIGQLHLEARPVARSIVKEVDRLALSTEEMKTHLRSFRKYVPADLVRSLMAAGKEANQGGDSRVVSVYFCDIANFTALSENLAPAEVVEHLGQFLKAVSEDIVATEGTVDKYIGDAVMAFWGAPALNPDHALAACKAALRNQAKLAKLREKWQIEGKPLFFARGGIHTGEVIVGNIGSEARLNYTVIGDTVNLASRMEGLNKFYGTNILITEHTYNEAKEAVIARPIDWVAVKGRHEAVLVYELLGLRGEVEPAALELVELYSNGLTLYRQKQWRRAEEIFISVLAKNPEDAPSKHMLNRCQNCGSRPLAENWDGEFHMEFK